MIIPVDHVAAAHGWKRSFKGFTKNQSFRWQSMPHGISRELDDVQPNFFSFSTFCGCGLQ